jgi:MFS family permease
MMIFAFIMAALAYIKVNGRPLIKVEEIVFLALGTGIAMSLNTPAYQALVPQLVPRKDLTNAIALNSAQFNMSRVLGPTLGGFAMAIFGVAGNFFLNGLSFLAVLIALTRIRYTEPAAPQEGHLWEKLKQGFAYVYRHPSMSSLVLLVGIGSLLAIPYLTFVPYFARDVLGTGEPGLLRRRRVSRRHHHRFSHAHSAAWAVRGPRSGRILCRHHRLHLLAQLLSFRTAAHRGRLLHDHLRCHH